MRQRHPRVIDDSHRKFVAGLPCILCGDDTTVQCAHIAYPELRWGKPFTAMAGKASDFYCVPLCAKHHDEQHRMNERRWWEMAGFDPIPVAMALYCQTGNHEAGLQIVNACRERVFA